MGFIILLEPGKAARAVEHIQATVELEDLYRLLGCETVDSKRLGTLPNGRHVDMWCDDNGLLNDAKANRQVGSWTICGTFLLCAADDAGESRPFSDRELAAAIRTARAWPILPEGTVKPEPKFTITVLD